MIDAAWIGRTVDGDTGSGNYTTANWETGAGKGITFTPAKGDTTKRLLFTNSGVRFSAGDHDQYPASGHIFSTTEVSATSAWYIDFSGGALSGRVVVHEKLTAFSLRCVRS